LTALSLKGDTKMSKLRAGDRVRVVNARGIGVEEGGPLKEGDIVTVDRGADDWVYLANTKPGFGLGFGRFELVSEKSTAEMTAEATTLPTDSKARKAVPLARGCLDYFPAALAEVARLSQAGNDKHNPGEELHHSRGKSSDHADCIIRHLAERGILDTDGFLHDVKVAWRALANLQEALEARGAPLARGARVDGAKP
jgi:hypothetical protein